MHTLIIGIIGIVLMAGALLGGINYLNFDSYEEKVFETVVTNDLSSFELLVDSHYDMYNYYPENSQLNSELEKIDAIIPRPEVGNYTYNYDVSDNSVAICYSLNANKLEMDVLLKLEDKGNYIMGNSCFLTANEIVDDGTYPKFAAITKWIKK